MSPRDPVHTEVGPDAAWTTVNVSEAMPGVLSPLTWTFWMPAIELGSRRSYAAQGIFPQRMTALPEDPADRFQAVFFGRAALNPDLARAIGDLTPGTTGAATEQRILGFARELPSASTSRRAPFIAVRLPHQARTVAPRVHQVLEDTRTWWRAATSAEPTDLADAVALLLDARRRFEAIIEIHTTATLVGLLYGELLERVVGDGALVARATSGLGDLEELHLVRLLVACAAGTATIDEVVAQHGFHGPDEGQLHARSWRQEPSQLEPLVDGYRTIEPDRTPAAVAAQQAAARSTATAALLAEVPRARRPLVRFLLRKMAVALPLREVGKSAFLMAIDGGRHGAYRAGTLLAAAGVLGDAEDVAYLTVEELVRLQHAATQATWVAPLVQERRARAVYYQTLELPTYWEGPPIPITRSRTDAAEAGVVLHGAGASPGVAEGRVLVAPDLGTAFGAGPGDIVVCTTTDPSWSAVFPVIDAIVVEVGSHLSHAAIVARELGLPCVVGIERATERLATGMRVRVDAEAGTVTILSPTATTEAR